jgi:hypothetical protein
MTKISLYVKEVFVNNPPGADGAGRFPPLIFLPAD